MLKPPIKPMLLFKKKNPFNSADYLFELKWDGYRTIVFINEGNIILQSRNGKDLTPYFPELNEVTQQLCDQQLILDGEICYLNKEGKPVFEELQGRIFKKNPGAAKSVNLIVWDILAYNQNEVYRKPLLERKELLQKQIIEQGRLIISPFILEKGVELFETAKKEQLEGIVAKKKDSPYEFRRSKYWYKIKIWQFIDVYIGGYSKDQSSLLVGNYTNNSLSYMGKIKLALIQEETTALFKFLPTIKIDSSPFLAAKSKGIYVKPLIKCRVRYTELSRHNTLRHGYAVKLLLK